jgi:pyridoxine 5'-phosphate synthase PdxJ
MIPRHRKGDITGVYCTMEEEEEEEEEAQRMIRLARTTVLAANIG